MFTYIQTYTHPHMHTYIHAYINAYTHVHTRTSVHKHTHVHVRVPRAHLPVQAGVRVRVPNRASRRCGEAVSEEKDGALELTPTHTYRYA